MAATATVIDIQNLIRQTISEVQGDAVSAAIPSRLAVQRSLGLSQGDGAISVLDGVAQARRTSLIENGAFSQIRRHLNWRIWFDDLGPNAKLTRLPRIACSAAVQSRRRIPQAGRTANCRARGFISQRHTGGTRAGKNSARYPTGSRGIDSTHSRS